jgi:hypothetical protein
LIPVTNEHPPALVTDSNARELSVGTTGEKAEQKDRFVKTTLQITDGQTIEEIDSGERRDLSCGYVCDKDVTPGVTKGIPGVRDGVEYDLIQRNIRYNHVAVTAKGRAGPEVSIPNFDAADDDEIAIMVTDSYSAAKRKPPQGAIPMETIVIDGVEYEVSKQAAQAYRKQQDVNAAAVADAKKVADQATARADAADDALKAERKKVEDAEAKAKAATDPQTVRDAVNARVRLVTDAAMVLRAHSADKDKDGKAIELTERTDAEIRELAIKAAAPDTNLDGKTDDYLAARFDLVVEDAAKANDASDRAKGSRNAIQAAAGTANADSDTPSAKKAREKMIKDSSEAWKKPTVGVFVE